METGRLLAAEVNAQTADDGGESAEDVEDFPEWGGGHAYVLYRRYVAEVQAALDLQNAACEEAARDEDGY